MINFRKQADGSLIAPSRGRPPDPPEGYVRDLQNSFRFIPVLIDCKYRTQKEKPNCGNCKNMLYPYCSRNGKFINAEDCLKCINQNKKRLHGKELYDALYGDPRLNYGKAQYNRCPGVRYFYKYLHWLYGNIVDLGCGTGDTVNKLIENGYKAKGIDWINGDHIVADITDELDLSEFDCAICIDVFEHVDDDGVLGILNNLKQVKRQVITIHTTSSKEDGYEQELHINIKNISNWIILIKQHLKLQDTIRLGTNRYLLFTETK